MAWISDRMDEPPPATEEISPFATLRIFPTPSSLTYRLFEVSIQIPEGLESREDVAGWKSPVRSPDPATREIIPAEKLTALTVARFVSAK